MPKVTEKNPSENQLPTNDFGQYNPGYVSEYAGHPTAIRLMDDETDQAAKSPPADLIVEVIGEFGIWQLRTLLILFLAKIPASWFMACIMFTAPELYPGTEFKCDVNNSQTMTLNDTVSLNQCYIERNLDAENLTERSECTKFEYHSDFQSVIMRFDLVCSRDILIAWTQFWHLFGVLAGGVLASKAMLYLSPRKVYLIGQVAQLACGVVTGYAPYFTLHCAFRCLSAVCCALMFTAGQTIFADITSGVYRVGAIILYDTFWSIGVIFLPSLAAFYHSWSHIYLGITFPTILMTLLLIWTPDSPRWLLKNVSNDNVVDVVEHSVREAAYINDRLYKIPVNFNQQLQELRQKLRSSEPPARFTELWRGPRAATNMIAAHISLSCFIINFMGMLLNIRSFGRDYIIPNTVAMGISEIFGCFMALHFALKYNRIKWQLAGAINIASGFLGCLGWIFTDIQMHPVLKVTLWMIIALIPKACVSCVQSTLLACMGELMPVSKKAPFIFSVVTFARVWLLTAPFIGVLKRFDVALSLSAYCALSVFGGILTCLIRTPPSSDPHTPSAKDRARNRKEVSPLKSPVWTVKGGGSVPRRK